jgi:hypothetical protein
MGVVELMLKDLFIKVIIPTNLTIFPHQIVKRREIYIVTKKLFISCFRSVRTKVNNHSYVKGKNTSIMIFTLISY